MDWTEEQRAVIAHPLDAHAVVRAVPGAGKTTTLVGRVQHLVAAGVPPERIRVVMFNRLIQDHFAERLAKLGIVGVHVQTFDALGRAVLVAANNQRVTSRRYLFHVEHRWGRQVWQSYREDFDSPEEIENGVRFWKAHLVPVSKAAFPSEPALVAAYRDWEALRVDGDVMYIGYEDMVSTAVALLRRFPGLLPRVDHFLIDELQDVNPGRVELVRLLSHPATTVMGVGDEDQGINEWCGAHPRYFHDYEATFPGLPTRAYTLSTSFRFGPTLARAANNLIANNAGRHLLTITGGGRTEGVVQHIEDVAAAVTGLLDTGWEARDIAVLYRGRSQGAASLAALVGAGIPVQTEDASLLSKGPGPGLALGYLRYATSNAPITFEEVWPIVQAPDRYIQKEAFQRQVARDGKRGLKAVLAERTFAESAGQNRGALTAMAELKATLEKMGRSPTAGAALELLTDVVDIEAQLTNRLRSEKDQETAIASFYAVTTLLEGLGVTPADAAQALEDLDVTRGAPMERRVLASTIHKVKGLEWRCVVLPGLIEGACPAEQRGAVPGTLEEPKGVPQSPWMEQERRVFYVGLTRASERVLLQASADSPSRFVQELLGPKPPPVVRLKPRKMKEIVEEVMRRGDAPSSAGRSWLPEEDDQLAAGWDDGETLTSLAERFGRSTSGIAARLVRIGVVGSRAEARERE